MNVARWVFRLSFEVARAVGKPFGGVRPRRIYDVLGRRAYPDPAYRWVFNRWGDELYLSPSLHIDRNILVFGAYDEDLHLALERLLKPGMVCMDVGANLGEMALHMARRIRPGGKVYAFEPVPHVFDRLRLHVVRNHAVDVIEAHAVAVSDQTGQCEIAWADESADNQGLASIINLERRETPRRTTIATTSLDDFVAEHGVARLDLLKVDIQGAEMGLIEGGRQTLARLGPALLLEVSPQDLRAVGKTSTDLCRLLEDCGYRIHLLLKGGTVGPRIEAANVPADFAATNVFCTPSG